MYNHPKNRRNFWRNTLFLLLIAILLIMSACGSGPKTETSGSSNTNTGDSSSSTGSTNQSETEEVVKIGGLMSFSGNFASLGEGMRNGLDLYLEMNDYKIGNRKVEIIYEDDENNPQVALRKYRKLVDSDQVDILVGIASSTILYALRDQVDKDQIPLIVANAGANDISWDQKSDYIYRTSYSNWQLGSGAAAFYADTLGKKVFIVGTDYPAGHEQVSGFEDAYRMAGGEVLNTVWVEVGTNDFATIMTQIAQADADFVLSIMTGSDALRFVMQYQEFGLKDKYPLITQASNEQAVTPESMEALAGSYNFMHYSPSLENEANKKFVAAFMEKYNVDSIAGYEVNGYDAGQALGEVLKKAETMKTEDIISVLKSNISYDSPRGPIIIDPATHNPIFNVYAHKIVLKDGKLDLEEIATIPDVAMPEKNPRN